MPLDPWKTHYGGERGGKQEEDQIQDLLLSHIHHLQQQQQQEAQPSSKKPSGASGQIVPVQGGHIVRATGRKDRHSKVCTAKGLRDRRVRLAAHTAIQFYDVQDRLGYDRPSKAVDWLIKNAKAAIDQLEQLPPWHPTAPADIQEQASAAEVVLSLDSDANADSFVEFPPDLLSRTSSHAQDLRLSLQSFQDPAPNVFPGPAHLAFDAANSVIPWNVAADNNDVVGGGHGGFVFSPQPALGQGQFYAPREPLQSSTPPSLRSWNDPVAAAAANGHQLHHSLFHWLSPSVHDIGFGPGGPDFAGFRIPASVQGKEEADGGVSDKPPGSIRY